MTGTLTPECTAGSLFGLQDLTIGDTSHNSDTTVKSIGITYVPVNHKLSVNAGNNSSITVKRTSSPLASATNGTLENGATVYENDVLQVTFIIDTGYNFVTHTVDGSSFTSGDSYTVPKSLSNNTLKIISTTEVKSFILTTSAGTGSSIVVNRTSSPKQGADSGDLSNGATIYYSDELQISFAASDGYNIETHMVNGSTFTSGNIYEVTDNVIVSSTASLKVYTLTLRPGTGSTINVNRTSSLQSDAATGALTDGATIYHFDVLVVTLAITAEYEIVIQTINGSNFVSGDSHTVIGAVEVATITRPLGIIYIDNGTIFEKYMVFIDNGTSWDQYIPYIDNGTKFVQYS